jgi:hypothetical protein
MALVYQGMPTSVSLSALDRYASRVGQNLFVAD